jgi:hypothetical protein
MGANLWKLTFARGIQVSSFTVVVSQGNSYEREYDCYCGGNVCATAEHERVLSAFNDRASRGGDMADRVIPGMVMEVTQGDRVRRFLVVEAVAFGTAPDRVDWAGGDPQDGPDYAAVDLYDLSTDPLGAKSLRFSPAVGGLWYDQKLYRENTGTGAFESMTLAAWIPPGKTEVDPDYWPAAGGLDADEFWWDPRTGDFKLSSSFTVDGWDVAQARWFISGDVRYEEVESYASVVVESPDATGYGSTADSLAGAAVREVVAPFDISFTVESGPASLSWRNVSSPDSVMIEFSWNSLGEVVSSSKRETVGGARATLTTNTVSRTFPFQVRLTWEGTTFHAYTRQLEADEWTPIWTSGEVLAGLDEEEDGIVGIFSGGSLYGASIALLPGETLTTQSSGSFSDTRVIASGEGAIMFREGADEANESAWSCHLSWDVTGKVDLALEYDSGIHILALVGATLTFPFEVGIDRDSGGIFTLKYRQDLHGGFTTAASVSGPTTSGHSGAFTREAKGGVRFYQPLLQHDGFGSPARDYYLCRMDCAATLGVQKFSTALNPEMTWDIEKVKAEAITKVRNLSCVTDMAQASEPLTRGQYALVSSSPNNLIRFGAENNGDQIQVTYAAGSTPSGTGRPPRTFLQANFATADPENPEQSTTALNQNIGNWHDHVVVYEEATGDLILAPGEEVSFCLFMESDPRIPPDLYVDVRAASLEADSSGSVTWSEGSSWLDTARMMTMAWNNAGHITGVQKRENPGGAVEDVTPLTSATYVFPFQVRCMRSGTSVRFWHRQTSGDAWVAAAPAVVLSSAAGLLRATQADTLPVEDVAATGDFDLTVDVTQASSSWKLVQPSDYLARYVEGIRLLKKTFIDSLGSRPFCFASVGKRGRAGGGFDANIPDEARQAVEGFDNLWTVVPRGGGAGRSMSGRMGPMQVGYTGWTCSLAYNQWIPTGAAWGTNGQDIRLACLALDAYSKTWPVWYSYGGATLYWDFAKRSWITAIVEEYCPSEPTNPHYDIDYTVAGEASMDIRPFDHMVASGLHWWWYRENFRLEGLEVVSDLAPYPQNYFGGTPGSVCSNMSVAESQFALTSIPFGIEGVLKRLPAGAVITSAKILAKFEGLRCKTWAGTVSLEPDGHYQYTYSEMGVLVSQYDSEGGISYLNPYYPDAARSADVTFLLYGKRKNTKSITAYDGSRIPLPSDTYATVGGGITTTAMQEGKWAILDVTVMLNALLAKRDSELSEFFLFPSVGSFSPDDDAADMSGILKSNFPRTTATLLTEPDGTYGFSATGSGTFVWFESLEFGEMQVQYRLGSLGEDEWTLPSIPPPAMV